MIGSVTRWARRIQRLALVASIGAGIYRWWQSGPGRPGGGGGGSGRRAPIGGDCPASHPVKVNDSSGIYHVPGGRFYDRTVAGRCYPSPEAAAADGYRPAKA